MATINIAGRGTTRWDGIWHYLGSSTFGGLQASGSVTVTRSSSYPEYLNIYGNTKSTLKSSDGSHSYGLPLKVGIVLGGTLYTVNHSGDSQNKYISGGEEKFNSGYIREDPYDSSSEYVYGSDFSYDIDTSITCTNNNTTLYIAFWCGEEVNIDTHSNGCTAGYIGSSSNGGESKWIVIGSLNTSEVPYKPHSNPSMSFNTSSWISKAGVSRSINYSYTTDGHNAEIWYNIDNASSWTKIDNLPRRFRFRDNRFYSSKHRRL